MKGDNVMKNRGILLIGSAMILIGLVGLLTNFKIVTINWGQSWPLSVLIPGILFEINFFIKGRKDLGLLVPGGILITYGILFYVCSIYGFQLMDILWPLFLMGPAIGLFQIYLFGNHDKAVLIPVGILGGLSLIFLISNISTMDFGGIVLSFVPIIVGVILISGTFIKNKKSASTNPRLQK